jgi:acyl-CoA thioesterase
MGDRFPLQDLLGLEVDSAEPGRAVAHIDITSGLLNPNGVAHGGVLFTAVDTAMGRAVTSLLGPDGVCASVEIHIRFLEPVHAGRMEATATVTRPGKRLMHLDAAVRSGGTLVATATGTFVVIGR